MKIGEGKIGGKVTNSSLQLVFLYDPLNKKMVYSSPPLKVFFNGSINMPEEAALPQLFGQDTESADEWQSCLQLKEEQVHEFIFTRKIAGEKDSLYHCHAAGIRVPVSVGTLYVLFLVHKHKGPGTDDINHKTERLQHMVDNYRREVSEFTDLAAHDLDAPLRKLSVLMDRVTDKIGEDHKEQVQPYVDRMRTCLTDMRALVDGLAMLSKLTTDTIGYVSCDIALIVEETVKELQPVIDHHKATIAVSNLPVIEGDTEQLKRLFLNLLENALRFSKKDEPARIGVVARPATQGEKDQWDLPADKSYFHIEIQDHGIGFNQKDAERLFEPFVRLRGKSEFPGSGLGLAVCKRIANNHHGIIYAEGKEDAGARFILLLAKTLN